MSLLVFIFKNTVFLAHVTAEKNLIISSLWVSEAQKALESEKRSLSSAFTLQLIP